MKKIGIVVLASLIVMLVMPLMFISAASAGTLCCLCKDPPDGPGGGWQEVAYDGQCYQMCGGASGVKTLYPCASGTSCGDHCSNINSDCGRSNLGYIWERGRRCQGDNKIYCVESCTVGTAGDAFKCVQQGPISCPTDHPKCCPPHNTPGLADFESCDECITDADCTGANTHCKIASCGGACQCDDGYQSCPEGSPNAEDCYTPETGGGCCNPPSGGCYEDFGLCTVCYGATWHSDWWCEEGECVPEASTVALFAPGLLLLAGYLRLKRKEN